MIRGDYKDEIQAIFEELCFEAGFEEYWDAPEQTQYELYQRATVLYSDRLADMADDYRERQTELREERIHDR